LAGSLRIHPAVGGVENNPQARLTLEQQVTRDITFTCITNVTMPNPRVMRVERSLGTNWPAVAQREEKRGARAGFPFQEAVPVSPAAAARDTQRRASTSGPSGMDESRHAGSSHASSGGRQRAAPLEAVDNSSPQPQSLAKAQSRKEDRWVLLCGFAPSRDKLFSSRVLLPRFRAGPTTRAGVSRPAMPGRPAGSW
jgi:hypothetical protein